MNISLKWKRRSVILLSLISLAALCIPVMSGYAEGELVSANLVVRGFNFVEFTPLGSVVLLTPLLLIGLQVSELNNKEKTILLFALALINAVSVNHAVICAYQWLRANSTSLITYGYGLPIYFFVLLAAQIVLLATCRPSSTTDAELDSTINGPV